MARKKKRVLKVKNIFIFFIILIGIACSFYYALTMPIRNIYIKNNHIVSDDEIIKLAQLDDYPSFLLTKCSDIRTKLEKNQYIDKVKVKKKFGNIISIDIREYQVIAISKNGMLILSNGVEIDNNYELSDIPVLINDVDDANVYHNFARKMEVIDQDILRQISEIEYSPVEVDGERFLLYMNDGNLVYITLTKIGKLNKYNHIKDKLDDKVGIIYLDAGDYVEVKKDSKAVADKND